MTRRIDLAGSLVALVTPTVGDEIDRDALEALVDWHVDQGTDGIVAAGTTGEAPTLSAREHREVLGIVIDRAAGRLPVIAGCGSNNTAEALGYHRFAAEAGADAALHVVGYYNLPDPAGVQAHFERLDAASDLPIIVYNVPPRTGIDIGPEAMLALSRLEHVIGVKDATGDLARISLERALIGDDFVYLSGEDVTALAYNAAGGVGCISVTANVAPRACAQFQRACRDGDPIEARRRHDALVPLHRALFAERSPAGVRYACSLLGLCANEPRLPLVPVSTETEGRIARAMGSVLGTGSVS